MKNLMAAMLILFIGLFNADAQSTTKTDFLYSDRFSLMFGLLQPVVAKGFNIEVNYFTKRMAFDYSHGISLDPPVVGQYLDQKLALHIPFTTGFGIGYRFNSFLDVRFEPKLHQFQLFNKDDAQTDANKIADFKTITFGFGVYYRYFPFKNSSNTFLQGITTSTSLRYWQNFGTTLRNDEISYLNKGTNKAETLKAPNIGIANTPIIFNIAVGYTFGGK